MKKLHVFAAAAVLGAMSMTASAENYWSAEYSTYDYDASGVAPAAIELSYGMSDVLMDSIDVEAYIGFGMGDDDDVEVASAYGLEAIYGYELSDAVTLKAQLGFNAVDIENGPFEAGDSGIGFGVGAEFAVGSGAITAQYRDLGEHEDGGFKDDVTSMSFGYKMEL